MNVKINFKTGTFPLHPNPNFNFQLNRANIWSNGDLDELKNAAAQITDAATWRSELLKTAEGALRQGRTEQAIAYYRMAEFFMYDGDSAKIATYDKAVQLFYNYHSELFASGVVKTVNVPFESGHLPVLYTAPANEKPGDVLLLHGGYDSYLEEFLPMLLYLRENGFAVYLFEGPGQGGVLRKQGMAFIPEWEKPVKAILDYFDLDGVTIVGLSLGGMLAPRAAAFEKRIHRVVAWSIFPNFLDIILATRPKGLQIILKYLLKHGCKVPINRVMMKQAQKDPLAEWGLRHGMHNMGVDSPYDYLVKAERFQYTNVGALITQDFLLIGAAKDHFIPVKFYTTAIDCLKNVKSLTYRLFTEKEHAENHCNAGNPKLVLDTIILWVKSVKE
jgi:pimeloyl-ACP methyl ester carboxylesterase